MTVARQAGGASDDNENFVDISGVTIESPDAYAEAGLAFFNASGRISKSVVGPLRTAEDASELTGRPHGWGVVMSNSLQGASEATVRRQVTVENTTVTGYQAGGVLFDQSRGPDGAATTLQRSGIIGYGRVIKSRILGRGATTLYAQTGVRWHAGARGSVSESEISGHTFSTDTRQSVALLLTDAELGPDPSNPELPAWEATANSITGNGYGLFNADITNATARTDLEARAESGWWGAAAGRWAAARAPAVARESWGAADITPFLTIAPPIPAVAAVTDAAPTGAFLEPLAGTVAPVGQPLFVTVKAADDFGVKSVTLSARGRTDLDRVSRPVRMGDRAGRRRRRQTLILAAEVTDSAGQRTTALTTVLVPVPAAARVEEIPAPALAVPAPTGRPAVAGDRSVGGLLVCDTGAWSGAPTAYAVQWLRAGQPITGATSSRYRVANEDIGSTISCRVIALNAAEQDRPPTPPASWPRAGPRRLRRRRSSNSGRRSLGWTGQSPCAR